jgi:hypothetical protein
MFGEKIASKDEKRVRSYMVMWNWDALGLRGTIAGRLPASIPSCSISMTILTDFILIFVLRTIGMSLHMLSGLACFMTRIVIVIVVVVLGLGFNGDHMIRIVIIVSRLADNVSLRPGHSLFVGTLAPLLCGDVFCCLGAATDENIGSDCISNLEPIARIGHMLIRLECLSEFLSLGVVRAEKPKL